MRSVLITGCNGFIGRNLTKYYIDKGDQVVGIDISDNNQSGTKVFVQNLLEDDLSEMYKLIKPDIFIHCAGNASVGTSLENPKMDFDLNVGILYQTLSCIKKAGISPKFIFLSSAAVYGNPEILPIEESFGSTPISPYGLHKKICEDICNYFRLNDKFDIKIARIFSAYGRGLKKQILWDMYNKYLKTGRIDLFGTGNETRDFIHVFDICRAIDCIISCNNNEPVFNIASGKEIKIKDLADIFAKTIKIDKSKINFNGLVKEGDPLNWRADIRKLKKLGFNVEITMNDGIRDYIEWTGSID